MLVLIQALRPFAHRFGYVDYPGGRKIHSRPIPLCGGPAIVLAVIFFGLLFSGYPKMWGLAGGLFALLALGMTDDRLKIPASVRVLGEVTVVLVFMCWWEGVTLESLGALMGGYQVVTTGPVVLLFTVFAAIGLINGINMIDGVDGLAGGFAALALGVFVTAVALEGSPALGILAFLIAAVAAFLVFNLRGPWRRRASVFLGDGGSLSLGFVLVWFAVDLSQGADAVLRPITMVWIFGLPIADTVYLFLRRILRGQSPFKADQFHFHHLLLLVGLRPGHTTAVWLAVAAVFAAVGLVAEVYSVAEVVLFNGYGIVFLLYFVFITYAWRRLEPKRINVGQITGD